MELLCYKYHKYLFKNPALFALACAMVCVQSSPICRFCREMCVTKGSALKAIVRSVKISALQNRLLALIVSLFRLYLNRKCGKYL